jgi:hypothetical protein
MPNNRNNPQTSPESEALQRAAIMAASGTTGRDIAAALGVSESTVSRWRQTPKFRAKVNEIQQGFQESAIAELRELALEAVRTLQDVMTDCEAPATARVAAAAQVLDRCGLGELPRVGPTDEQAIAQGDRSDAELGAMLEALSQSFKAI